MEGSTFSLGGLSFLFCFLFPFIHGVLCVDYMRILICGDRNWKDIKTISEVLGKLPRDTIIIQGEARGADRIAKQVALKLGLKVESYPADWTKYGRAAGPLRNLQMLNSKPDAVWAFHNNIESSKGTKHCVAQAKLRGLPVIIFSS